MSGQGVETTPYKKIGDGVQMNELVAMMNLSEAKSRGFDNFD